MTAKRQKRFQQVELAEVGYICQLLNHLTACLMPLSWNEIKTRAIAVDKEWEHDSSEDAEAKSF